MNRKIIAINGLIGSGKDTIAEHLKHRYKFSKMSFASKLKDTVSVMFSLDRNYLEGYSQESRNWREKPIDFWTSELGYTVTPRSLLQQIGTEAIRNNFHPDTWALILKQHLLRYPIQDFVIPDLRMRNETRILKDMKAYLWRVKRGPDPEWWEIAKEYNKTGGPLPKELENVHATERELAGFEFDAVIENDGSLEELYEKIEILFAQKIL